MTDDIDLEAYVGDIGKGAANPAEWIQKQTSQANINPFASPYVHMPSEINFSGAPGATTAGNFAQNETQRGQNEYQAGQDAYSQQQQALGQEQQRQQTEKDASDRNQKYLKSQSDATAQQGQVDSFQQARNAARRAKGNNLFGAWG